MAAVVAVDFCRKVSASSPLTSCYCTVQRYYVLYLSAAATAVASRSQVASLIAKSLISTSSRTGSAEA
jgi:hypothetical protein